MFTSSACSISLKSLETSRRVLARFIRKKIGILIIHNLSFYPRTKKPSSSRMGKGKGSKIQGYFVTFRPGSCIFSVCLKKKFNSQKIDRLLVKVNSLLNRSAIKLGLNCFNKIG